MGRTHSKFCVSAPLNRDLNSDTVTDSKRGQRQPEIIGASACFFRTCAEKTGGPTWYVEEPQPPINLEKLQEAS